MNTKAIIDKFHMLPHKEGGYYAEIRKSTEPSISQIYYLLEQGETAQWHRIGSEELWLFHDGGELLMTLGGTDAVPVSDKTFLLSKEDPSFLVPQNQWQTARAINGAVLVSCVVFPAFTEERWELYPKETQK